MGKFGNFINYSIKKEYESILNEEESKKVTISNVTLKPWWLTGFSDAEGSFIINIYRDNELKTGWRVKACFQIGLHVKDVTLLKQIQAFFGVGKIYLYKDSAFYVVTTASNLKNIIIPHFTKFPLITQKKADFILWK